MTPRSTARRKRLLAWAAAVLVLALVFAAYLRPAMVFSMANQLWNCF
jgi:type II secretory pathway component PulM